MSRRGAPAAGNGSWRRRAACRGLPAELFFAPEGPSAPWSPEPAQAVCASCPVSRECRAWAVATRQKHGVWGGLSEQELRRRIAPRRRAS